MESDPDEIARYLALTRLPPAVLAEELRCGIGEVEGVLAGAYPSAPLRDGFKLFRERRERNLATHARGWLLLADHWDEIWGEFTTAK